MTGHCDSDARAELERFLRAGRAFTGARGAADRWQVNVRADDPALTILRDLLATADTGDQTRDGDRLVIHPRDIVGNAAVRKIAGYYLGHEWRPVTRPTLLKWREQRGFPAPLPCERAGTELWDAREVREWCKAHAARRAELEANYY